MGLLLKFLVLITSAGAFWGAYKFANVLSPPPLPKLDDNAYWGPGKAKPDNSKITPFKIQVTDEVLTDLKTRLSRTRELTKPLEGINFQYGFNTDTLKKVIDFWLQEYKWRERETFLNQFPQYKTQIQGLDIHYIHVKPKITGPIKRTVPLILLHGWPGSVREFYSLIPLLTENPLLGADYAFEVIVPSLPGYGFSQGASKPGLGSSEMAVIFKNLMLRLGHQKFYIQGGDWGALIGSTMATLYPDNVLALHSNMCGSMMPMSTLKMLIGSVFPSFVIEEKHQNKLYPLSNTFMYIMEEMGYLHLQSTKPDTIGIALTDSPAGLAAYILEKFSTWTNPSWKAIKDGSLTSKFTYTDLLDNIMIYWVTGSITTSMRLYSETMNKRHMSLQIDGIPTEVPTSCARFPHDIMYYPDALLTDKYHKLIQSNDFEDGGHFAAFELPKVMANDIWSAFNKVQALKNTKKN